MRTLAATLGLAVTVTACSAVSDVAESSEAAVSATCVSDDALTQGSFDQAVTQWLASSATDLSDDAKTLARILEIVGDAKVVGLGEPEHGLHEFPALRNEVFKMLVERKDARAITFESGILEARIVDRYVTDVDGATGLTLDEVLAKGFTHDMGEWDETADLVEWTRAHNIEAKKAGKPLVRWGGKDLSVRGDTLTVPLAQLAPIFEKAGASPKLARFAALATKAAAVTDFMERILAAHVPNFRHIDPDHLDAVTSLSYDQLTEAEQAQLRTELAALATDVKDRRTEWVARIGEDETVWVGTLLLVAQQMVDDLDHRAKVGVEYGPTNSGGGSYEFIAKVYAAAGAPVPPTREVKFIKGQNGAPPTYTPAQLKTYGEGRAIREVHLADNVIALEKRFGRTLNFAASSHLQRVRMMADAGGAAAEGMYLAAAYKKDYVVIGGTASVMESPKESGKPEDASKDAVIRVIKKQRDEQAARPGTIERRFESHGASGLLVDLGGDPTCRRPQWVKDWLATPQLIWVGSMKYDFVPTKTFDALFWYRTATVGHRRARRASH